MDIKFKPGDKVILEIYEATPPEGSNWAQIAGLIRGNEYTVAASYRESDGEWIRLEGEKYSHPATKFRKVEEGKYTIEYCKGKKIAVNVHNEEQFEKLISVVRISGHRYGYSTPFSYYGDKLCIDFEDGCYCDVAYYKENGYEVIDFSQLNFNEKMKKIIGYKSPFDLFEGNIKAGSIFKQLTSATYKTDEVGATQYSKHLPKEIVENWEPVYEEEKITIEKYDADFTQAGFVVFGCQKISRVIVASLLDLLKRGEIRAELKIEGQEITPQILESILKQIK